MKELEQVIADAHAEADVLRRAGATMSIDRFEQWLRDVENATVDFRVWLSEDDAVFRSDYQRPWFRQRFPAWLQQGLARYNPLRPRERQYRQLVVPLRANRQAAREAGRRGERMTG